MMYRKCILENITKREIAYLLGDNVYLSDNSFDPRNIVLNEADNCVYAYGQPVARVDGDTIFSYTLGYNVATIDGNTIRVIANQTETYEILEGDECTNLEKAALYIGARR